MVCANYCQKSMQTTGQRDRGIDRQRDGRTVSHTYNLNWTPPGSFGPHYGDNINICPHIVLQRTPVGSIRYYMYVSLFLHLSVSLSGCLCLFLVIICRSRNCAQRMLPQASGSNTRSGSTSVRLSVGPLQFLYLY